MCEDVSDLYGKNTHHHVSRLTVQVTHFFTTAVTPSECTRLVLIPFKASSTMCFDYNFAESMFSNEQRQLLLTDCCMERSKAKQHLSSVAGPLLPVSKKKMQSEVAVCC
jgi:hypothetical protein